MTSDEIYADNAHRYVAAGWAGVLPLPRGKKYPPPEGYTGRSGVDPSPADIQTWIEDRPGSNIAVRLPPTVVGLDVDAYGEKCGGETLAALESELGVLPPTVMTTSRQDGVSGIRWYRARPRPSWSDLGPGIEIVHHGWRYAVVPPSTNPETDDVYRWIDTATGHYCDMPSPDDLPELPPAWVDRFSSDRSTAAKVEVDDEDLVAWRNELPEGRACTATARALGGMKDGLSTAGSRHDAALKGVAALVRAGERGHRGVDAALDEARKAFETAVSRPGQDRRSPQEIDGEWRRMVVGAVGMVTSDPTPDDERGCRCRPARRPSVRLSQARTRELLGEVITTARGFLDLPDPAHLVGTLAAAATRDLEEEPTWLLLVGPPSSGKTEAISSTGDVVDGELVEVTLPGLLSWSKGKQPKPVGVLTRVPPKCLITLGDLSSLLAASDRGDRDQLYAVLRQAYDGKVLRDLGNAPRPLEWTGRLTLIAAVTEEIDRYSSHANALGPRWLYLRLLPTDLEGQRRKARAAAGDHLEEHRAELREQVSRLVEAGNAAVNEVEVSEQLSQVIEDAALVCCWGRAAVPRYGYGSREIDGLPVIEEPPRLIRQLRGLAKGALAIGLDEVQTAALCRRVALDSMPAARRRVLDALAGEDHRSIAGIARKARIDRKVAKRQLEELLSIGVVDEQQTERAHRWWLDGERGELIARVVGDNAEVGWAEVWPTTSPSPHEGRGRKPHRSLTPSHTSAHPRAKKRRVVRRTSPGSGTTPAR